MPERQLGEVPEATLEAAMVALPMRRGSYRADARAALEAACDPALGDQRLVVLGDVLDVLEDAYPAQGEDRPAVHPADVVARTFGGEPDGR